MNIAFDFNFCMHLTFIFEQTKTKDKPSSASGRSKRRSKSASTRRNRVHNSFEDAHLPHLGAFAPQRPYAWASREDLTKETSDPEGLSESKEGGIQAEKDSEDRSDGKDKEEEDFRLSDNKVRILSHSRRTAPSVSS